MPIRPVTKKYSDRGSIKDIAEGFYMTPNEPATPLELRMKELYEYSQVTHDAALQRELGFIVMSEPGNKAAFPVTVMRHREYLNSLSQEMKESIEQNRQILEECFDHPSVPSLRMQKFKQADALHTVLQTGGLVKNASAGGNRSSDVKRSFRRVR